MPKLTPDQAAKKWGTRLRGAVTDIQTGIDRVTTSPGVAAVAKKDKWVARMVDPATHAKWEAKTRAVDLSAWKSITKTKVSTNLSGGVTAAEPKVTQVYGQMFPYMQSLEDRIAQMPDVTLSDSKARANAWIDGMAAYVAR